MASRTQTVTRPKPSGNRAYDHLYDPVYTMSSGADLGRAEARTVVGTEKTVPSNSNMFSELKHRPRAKLQPQSNDPVPQSIARDFQDLARQQHMKAKQEYRAADPTGRNLHKYTGRPRAVDAAGAGDTTLLKFAQPPSSSPHKRAKTPKTRTIMVQTDYRESETQTDPWTPDYIVRPGSAPEVLTLATLSHGQGLPAGLAEVEMIERARAKREWERNLPPCSDPARLRLMEEQEAREWKVREEEIEAIQAERLRLMQEAIMKREDQRATMAEDRLERLWNDRQMQHDTRIQKLETAGLKTLRKLTKKRQNIQPGRKTRDVVKDYVNPSSTVFAPQATMGAFSYDNKPVRKVESNHLNSLEGLLDLEATLPKSITQPRIRVSNRKSARGKKDKTTARFQDTLKDLDRSFKLMRTQGPTGEPPLRLQEKVEPDPVRPPTPEAKPPPTEAEDLAIIRLQSLLRGRAIQTEMCEGKELRRELIEELRSTHALQKAQQEIKEQERQEILKMQQEVQLRDHEANTKRQVFSTTQSKNVGAALDFFSKELVRLQEERRVHAFAMLAERQRRIREAEESGKRQEEEVRRTQNDEIFRQIVDVHQSSVDTYLEDILMGAQEDVADQQARVQIRKQAEKINRAASEAQARGEDTTYEGAQAISADLVSSFLLPEVQRQARRDGIIEKQKKFLDAAHKVVHAETKNTEEAIKVAKGPSLTETLETEEVVEPPLSSEQLAEHEALETELEALNARHKAAVKIQARYRGFRTRKSLSALPRQTTPDVDAREAVAMARMSQHMEHEAAVKIQANYRGFRVRRDSREASNASINLQPQDAATEEAAEEQSAKEVPIDEANDIVIEEEADL